MFKLASKFRPKSGSAAVWQASFLAKKFHCFFGGKMLPKERRSLAVFCGLQPVSAALAEERAKPSRENLNGKHKSNKF